MKTNLFAEVLSAAARPAVAIIFAAGFVDCVVNEVTPPPWFLSIGGIALTWVFTDRTLKHRAERKASKEVKNGV